MRLSNLKISKHDNNNQSAYSSQESLIMGLVQALPNIEYSEEREEHLYLGFPTSTQIKNDLFLNKRRERREMVMVQMHPLAIMAM